jgi:dihydroneopterin aldolase
VNVADAITIRGLRVPARIGVTADERDRDQVVIVDLDVEVDLTKASRSDNLADTLDYGSLVAGIAQIASDGSRNLLENLSGDIASFVLRYEGVEAVTIEVAKADVPVEEDVGSISVRMRRTRDE